MIDKKPFSASLSKENIEYIENEVAKKQKEYPRYKKSHWLDDLVTHLRAKAETKKPKTQIAVIEPVYPEGLNVLAWEAWIEFRKKAKFKKYKTDSAMKKLAQMGTHEEQSLIVQQSMDNEYQGLFPLKKGFDKTEEKPVHDWHLQEQGF